MGRLNNIVLLLTPMIIYYSLLYFIPHKMAVTMIFGWPLTILLGVMVMLWALVVAFFFAYQYNQSIHLSDPQNLNNLSDSDDFTIGSGDR